MSADSGTTPGGAIFNERYEVVAPISSGAMGAVYRAVDLASGGEVAIKRLLDVKHAARFEIEARLLASLSHPLTTMIRALRPSLQTRHRDGSGVRPFEPGTLVGPPRPQCLPCAGIGRNNGATGARREVKHPTHHDGGRFGGHGFGRRPAIIESPPPGHLQRPHVAAIDLIERRVAGARALWRRRRAILLTRLH